MAAWHFESEQRAFHREADPEHFDWQTRAPYFSESEARLLEGLRLDAHERLLEIGCGEGGNLHHLRDRGRLRVGIDSSAKKAGFASRHSGARALVADATRLPFGEGAFDVVLIRDLLHHVGDRQKVLREARRVVRPGGRLFLIEPNALSPLIVLQAALVPEERGVRGSTAERLSDDLRQSGFVVTSHRVCQPLPLMRVLLHPRLPLGERRPLGRALEHVDNVLALLMPRRRWMYLVYEAVRA
jgi:SAM-dependent methyltransferase